MRIGINALYLIPGGVGGTEIYLRSLLAALQKIDHNNEYFVFVNRETVTHPLIDSPGFHLIPCPVSASSRPLRILWEQIIFPRWLHRHAIHVLLNPGFTMPVLFLRPSVTVFHDLQHKRHPEFFRWFDLPFWNLLLWASAKRSASLIAVSEATARDLARYYPGTAGKTVIIPHGVDPECFRIGDRRRNQRRASGVRLMLTISTLHPHKNIGRLMQAFQSFRSAHHDYRLVVAGLKGFAATELESQRQQLGLGDCVTFTGWIPRASLHELLETADAYMAPSRFEGFGMPILEALAAGIPSACSNIAPLNEVAGTVAAWFDPNSVSGMTAAMELITGNTKFREQAATDGPLRARQFDWNATAAKTLSQLENQFLPSMA